MMTRTKWWLLAALAMSAGVAAPARAAEQVPFKGQEAVVLSLQPSPDPSLLYFFMSGTGVATHLGQYTTSGHHFFDPTTGCTLGGESTITAANGDRLFATYTVCIVSAPSLLGEWTITGGTGRFAGATGSYTAIGAFGPGPEVPTTFVLEGKLSTPGANKK
jgi:hypothetical protein